MFAIHQHQPAPVSVTHKTPAKTSTTAKPATTTKTVTTYPVYVVATNCPVRTVLIKVAN
ncbi:hypothetical protein [Nocardioides sp.]|uniref:hypothetical protein n=1 Tax=Nocardioides sp. TaxID=35761 RepID=UPI00261264D1|nr:hypothetical protein [Nocardioides sp.]